MRVLVDTNIVLDFLLQREPFFQDADLLFQVIDTGQIVGHVTATTLTDIFYIARKHTRVLPNLSCQTNKQNAKLKNI